MSKVSKPTSSRKSTKVLLEELDYKRTIKQRLVLDMVRKELKNQPSIFLKEVFLTLKLELQQRAKNSKK